MCTSVALVDVMTSRPIMAIIFLLLAATLNPFVYALPAEDRYKFEIERRINAHGNEFMAIALTADAKRLIVGTESGDLIVWGIPERRIVTQFNQRSPVHCVVALKDPDLFVAAGGPHSGANQRGVIRRWRISSGESEDWQGPSNSTFLELIVDPVSGLVAASNTSGDLAVWNSATAEPIVRNIHVDGLIVGLALVGREIYVSSTLEPATSEEPPPNSILRYSVDKPTQRPTIFKEDDGKTFWYEFRRSPDSRFIAARRMRDHEQMIALIHVQTGKEVATFDAKAAAWSANGNLILFDHQVAIARITVDKAGRVSRTDLLKSAEWHRAGTPTHMTGQVVSPDGATAWQTFQFTAALVELNFNKKKFDLLHHLNGYVYALHASEPLDLIVTGGDDEMVRVRKLSDLTLIKEFRAQPGVPQGVALMDGGRHVIFSASARDTSTTISVGDLVSGSARILLTVTEPFVSVKRAVGGFIYNRSNQLVLADPVTGASIREFKIEGNLGDFAVSANGALVVAANREGKIFCFDVTTGKQTHASKHTVKSLTRLTITGDGHYVYTVNFESSLQKWDTRSDSVKELASIRGQARTLVLSSDEKRLAVGGNHHDVAIYDVETGERLTYFQVAAADFYVTNVWVNGDRLLFSTDAGVMFDGRLKR